MATNSRPQLSERQRDVYLFIHGFHNAHGYPPTIREIGARFGIMSPNGVICHLRAMESKGYITRCRSTARGIKLGTAVVDNARPVLPHGGTIS